MVIERSFTAEQTPVEPGAPMLHTYDDMLVLAKRVHGLLIELGSGPTIPSETRRRLLQRADEVIDAAASVDETDWHQVLETTAVLQLRLDTLRLSGTVGGSWAD